MNQDAAVLVFAQAVAATVRDLERNPQPTNSLREYALTRLREHAEQVPEASPAVRRLAGRLVDAVQEVLVTLDHVDRGM